MLVQLWSYLRSQSQSQCILISWSDKHQLLSGSNHSEQHFLPPILFLTPSPVSELWDSSEACHQKPTPGLCLSLSHRRVVQVSGPRGSVSDRAMRVPAVPTGITAGERGQKSSSAPLPSSPNGSPLGSLQGSFISFPGNRMQVGSWMDGLRRWQDGMWRIYDASRKSRAFTIRLSAKDPCIYA